MTVDVDAALLDSPAEADAAAAGGKRAVSWAGAAARAPGTSPCTRARRGSDLVLTVEDDGVGMDAATLARGAASSSPQASRAGSRSVGLANVHERLKLLLRRRLWPDDRQRAGQGHQVSRCRVPPALLRIPARQPATADRDRARRRTPMLRLLIADDEDLVRRGLAALIEREAPDYHHRRRGGRRRGGAGNSAARSEPDVVLTDIRMPGAQRSGSDRAAARAACRALHCIILSGYDEFDYARRAVGLGVADYLLKPVDPDELLALLRRLAAEIAAERRDASAHAAAARLAAEQGCAGCSTASTWIGASLAACFPPAPAWGLLLVQRPANAGPPQRREHGLGRVCRARCTSAPWWSRMPTAISACCFRCAMPDTAGVGAVARRLYAGCCARRPDGVAVTAARPCASLAGLATRYQRGHGGGRIPRRRRASRGPLLSWEVLPHPAERWPALPAPTRRPARRRPRGLGGGGARARHALLWPTCASICRPARCARSGSRSWCCWSTTCSSLACAPMRCWRPARTCAPFCVGAADAEQLEARSGPGQQRAARDCRRAARHHSPRGAIAELREYIESHLDDDLTITHPGAALHLNAKYLGELFKQTTGESLGEFVIRTRMKRACELLADSPLKVYAVAEQVGYAQSQAFRHHVSLGRRRLARRVPRERRRQAAAAAREVARYERPDAGVALLAPARSRLPAGALACACRRAEPR